MKALSTQKQLINWELTMRDTNQATIKYTNHF